MKHNLSPVLGGGGFVYIVQNGKAITYLSNPYFSGDKVFAALTKGFKESKSQPHTCFSSLNMVPVWRISERGRTKPV